MRHAGAGPAGLSAAIKFKQMAKERNLDLSVCVLEKGSSVGELAEDLLRKHPGGSDVNIHQRA